MSEKRTTGKNYQSNSKLSLCRNDKARYSSANQRRRAQSGMTLLVGLILLMMLMVISVIGFRNTTLSERMTGNAVDRNVSFQSAESAGKEALQIIESAAFAAGTSGQYAPSFANGSRTDFWTKGAGAAGLSAAQCATASSFSWVSCAAQVPSLYANNSERARYVIERISEVVTPTSGLILANTVSTFRVTSRSTGGSGNAEVVLQVIYVRTTEP